uniref:Nuclear receptor domain-containing protein n=1 Tax=Panagrellus redivivus TaxID=6233 RepID=A0A7E4UT17_PANRE
MQVNSCNVFDTSNDVVLPEVLTVPFAGNKTTVCAICGGISLCRHFGAVSCNSCAAFFRRTISGKKNFTCALINNCVIDFRFVRRICKACRLRKCISAGMRQDEQKAIEHLRVTHLPPSPYPFRKTSFLPNISEQVVNERRFCKMYLDDTGIFDLAKEVMGEEFTGVENYWNYVVVVLNTLKYDSIQDRKLTVIDHSMMEMSETAWYSIVPQFQKHLDLIVKTVSPLYCRVEKLIQNIRTIGLTNEELAFFLFLAMVQGITRLTSEPKVTRLRFQPLLDTVFRSMHVYYQENFPSDYMATRMGNLIMALPIMDVSSFFF